MTVSTDPMLETVPSRAFIEMNIRAMRILNEGMAGMTHAKDIAVAEALRDTPLPPDVPGAMLEWRRKLNDAVVKFHQERGMDIPISTTSMRKITPRP